MRKCKNCGTACFDNTTTHCVCGASFEVQQTKDDNLPPMTLESDPQVYGRYPTIDEWAAIIQHNADVHGFNDRERVPAEFVTLIHAEASEVYEEFRKGNDPNLTYYSEGGKPEGIPSEIVDVIIRAIDMANYYGIDIQKTMWEKMQFNKTRPYMHGKVL